LLRGKRLRAVCVGVRRAHACGGWGFRGSAPRSPAPRKCARWCGSGWAAAAGGAGALAPWLWGAPVFYAVGVAEAERIAEGGGLRGVLPSLSGEARVSAFVPGYGGARLRLLACAR
jgi:hypothetical protein